MNYRNMDINILNELSSSSKDLFFVIQNKSDDEKSFYTPNVLQITGYTTEELNSFPQKHYSLIPSEKLENFLTNLKNFENDKTVNFYELNYKITTKSGELLLLKENIRVTRNTKGEVKDKFIAVIKTSLTSENGIDYKEKYEKLKELNASKDQFISIVSHDLRSPFTTLLGFSEILLNETDITEEEKVEYLQYIYDSSKTQLTFINSLLDWSRLQTGRVQIDPSRLNVKNTIANAITPLTGSAIRKNIEIKIDIEPDFYVNADERLIGQAIVHLVDNAVKYTADGKKVNVSATRFKEGMIEIIVSDEGVGISEENQDKLFRIDKKLALPGTSGEKGSGMGLTLTKEIIEKHGGQIWFYSQLNEGTEFHLTLPEAKNTVLIVEDDLNLRANYKNAVESNLDNFEVKTADNGYEAINLIRNVLPTVIVIDHDMPLMDGIQFVEAMAKRDSGNHIPVIVISAKLDDELKRRYSRLGIGSVLSKPVNFDLLVNSVRECLFQL